ncbi:Canalicular multispecific organic anion transporter 2 [Boothiomyces sp. JEL0866]|nr:Canalicular multispecific organic anion transporter 2 [Boothiomyces sp. JEL0866]
MDQKSKISTNPFNYVTLSWLTPLLLKGKKSSLQDTDLYELSDKDKSDAISKKFQVYWNQLKKHKESPLTAPPPSFFWIHISILKWPLIGSAACATLSVFLGLFTPLALQQLINYIDPSYSGTYWIDNGVALAVLLFTFQALGAIFDNLQRTIFRRTSQINNSILIGAIYEKTLRLSTKSKLIFPEGKIMNMINQDVGNIAQCLASINEAVLVPVQIILSIVLLIRLIGNTIWAGLGIFVAITLLALATSGRTSDGFTGADKRIGILREMLYGIKIVKFQAMEDYFKQKIDEARQGQIDNLKKILYTLGGVQSLALIAPTIIAVTVFALYASAGNQMNASIVFPALSYITGIVTPLNMIQLVISNVITGRISFQRIAEFLLADEKEVVEPNPVKNDASAISLKKVTWKWEEPITNEARNEEKKEAFQIYIDDLTIAKGKLVGVVGSIGSGKSSFYSGLIGDSTFVGGDLNLNGKIAYCSQIPWILTGSIEKNVLFNSDLDKARLDKVIAASGLESDLKMLSHGIKTEIGENGVNLSGGQKARVSLARSLYADADIYLLDDPIAALDAQVGRLVFSKAIKDFLKSKTVLISTHQLHYLQEVDEIIVLEQGKVVEQGTFTQLNSIPDGILSRMLQDYRFDDKVTETGDEPAETKEVVEKQEEKVQEFASKEEKNKGGIKFQVYWTLFKNIGIPQLTIVMTLYLLSFATQIFLPVWLSKWTESVDNNGFYLKIYSIFGGVYAVIHSMMLIYYLVMAVGVSIVYHNGVMDALYHAPMDFFDRNPIGRIINRLSGDIQALDTTVLSVLLNSLLSFTEVMIGVIMICQASYILLVPVVVITGIFYSIFTTYQPNNRDLKRLNSNSRSPLDAHITESLAGSSTIVAYNVQKEFVEKQRKLTDDYTACNYIFLSVGIWFSWRISVISSIITLILAIFGGASKNYSAGLASSIGLALSFSSRLSEMIDIFLVNVGSVEVQFNTLERLHHYRYNLASEAPFELKTDPKTEEWPSKGELEINNLELRYPARPEFSVIKNLSIKVNGGEKIGVVGRTGSGKSTLVSALFRIIEASQGSISIDGADISKLGLHTLRSRLQMIPQEPILFEGTFRSNLDYSGVFSDEELWQVLEYAGLKTFVSELDDKLESKITANGENLSVGQRQLICLARAILQRPKFMVMDEATSSVDGESDQLIQKAIKEHFSETTIISIAHRLNTIAEFDRVLVLDAGELKEFDSPHILLNTPGSIFADLAEASGTANAQLIRELASGTANARLIRELASGTANAQLIREI